jgi:hypothetical protein
VHFFDLEDCDLHNRPNGSFIIPLFSRSIALANGDIYLTGGMMKPYYLQTTF